MTTRPDHAPQLHEAVISEAQLETLLADIEHCAQVAEVQVKRGRRGHTEAQQPSLRDAIAMLQGGAVRAVQVVYRHAQIDWIDTLIAGPSGVKLIRTRACT